MSKTKNKKGGFLHTLYKPGREQTSHLFQRMESLIVLGMEFHQDESAAGNQGICLGSEKDKHSKAT